MKNLSGTLVLLSGLCLAVAMAEPTYVKPSQKLNEVDSLARMPELRDTALPDSINRPAILPIDAQHWKYEPLEVMPDPSVQVWWQGFNDPVLDSLIAVAVRNNYDIRMAARRMELNNIELKKIKSGYYPVINASAGWTGDRTSAYMANRRGYDSHANYFNLGLEASWEIDVFGRISQQSNAGQANLDISRADYAAAISSLCAQLTGNYINLRVFQAQLEVAQRLSISQQEVLRIAEVRHECTLASGLDVSQAKTVCLATQATVPQLKTSITQTINAIRILTGNNAPGLINSLSEKKPIPVYSMPIDVEITPSLLRRRPDIQAAEQQIAAYAAQIGVAKKDFLPTLSLNASVGTAAHNLGDLFKHDALTYNVQPTLSWTVFSGLSRKYAVAEAKEQMLIGIDEYNLTVQQASAEVDNAIVAYRNSIERIGMLNEVLGESIKSFDFALDQYKQGLSPFLNLINAQIDVLNYNNELVAERGNAQIAVMELYKALGGGW